MSESLLTVLVLSGVVAASVGSVVAYVDASRRSSPFSERFVRVVALGVATVGSFLVPYAFEGQLRYAYFEVVKSSYVVVSPYEWTAVNLATGAVVCAVVVSLYVVGSRRGTRSA